MTRTIIKYHGGKSKLAPWIISHMPEHKIYVELFGGAMSVLLAKPPVATEIYNDLNGEVANLFRVVREHPEKLAAMVSMSLYSRAEMLLAYQPSTDPVEQARRTIVKAHQAIKTTSINKESGFRTSINSKDYCSQFRTFATLPEIIFQVRDRLANVAIEQRDAFRLIDKWDMPKTLLYLDPPYLPSTRSKTSNARGYQNDLTFEQHSNLLEMAKLRKGMVMISGYDNPLYNEALKDWRRYENRAYDDNSNLKREVLWCNFPPVTRQARMEF